MTEENKPEYGVEPESKAAQEAEEARIVKVFDVLAAEISRVVSLMNFADPNSLPGLIAQYKGLVGQVKQIAAASPRLASTRISLKSAQFNNAKTNVIGGSVAIADANTSALSNEEDKSFDEMKKIVGEGAELEFAILVGVLEAIEETIEQVAKKSPELQKLNSDDVKKELEQEMLDALKTATESEGFSKWLAAQKDKSMDQGSSLGHMVGNIINKAMATAREFRNDVKELAELGLENVAGALGNSKDLMSELKQEKELVKKEAVRDIGKEDLQASSVKEEKAFDGIDMKGIFGERIGANTFKLEADPKLDKQGKEVPVERLSNSKLGALEPDALEKTRQPNQGMSIG